MAYYLGLDLGGTAVKAGVTNTRGKLLAQTSAPTGPARAEAVIAAMVAAGEAAIAAAKVQRRQIAAVGILSPGQSSLQDGIVYRAANFPAWKNVPLRAKVSRALGIPGVLENDANAAAYGEYWAGAGKGRKIDNLVMLTLGTGIGSGFVYRGRVIHGSHDSAAELGHTIVEPDGAPCGCGQRGCLEVYASAGYTAKRAEELLTKRPSTLRALARQRPLTSADVVAHARRGDALAREVWQSTCRYIAIGCINAARTLDPQLIVLGGGMSAAGTFLLRSVQKELRSLWWKMTPITFELALAKLGNTAGIVGAAGVAMEAHRRGTI